MSARETLGKLRLRAARYANRALLGELVGGLPATGARSLMERSYHPDVAPHVADLSVLRPTTVLHYEFPPSYPLWFRRTKALDDRIIASLRNVRVAPRTGLVWLPGGGPVVEESIGSLRRLMGWGGALHDPLVPIRPLRIERPVIPLPFQGYYHWLLESLPAAMLAKRLRPEAALLIDSRSPTVLREAIVAWLGADALREEVVMAQGVLHASELVFAALSPYSGFANPEDLKVLRDTYGAGGGSRRVYVSRGRTPRRQLANESEVEAALTGEGVEVVHAEDLDFSGQWSLFSDAKLIVGPHGAGLANLVWSTAPSAVVEIFPSSMVNDCYARLASSLGLKYDYLIASPDAKTSGRVDIAKLMGRIPS